MDVVRTDTKRTVDRRVQRTRQLLRDAVLALILEKGYDSITVQDITDRANLGRATFYLHYRDKEDLLLTSLETVYDELVSRIQASPAQAWRMTGRGGIALAFQHAAEHADLYRIILSARGARSISRRIRDYIAAYTRHVVESIQAEESISPQVPLDVLSSYIAVSLMGLITWWLENDMPYSADEMVELFRQLNLLGSAQAIGIRMPTDTEPRA